MSVGADASSPVASEGCPPPLDWSQVLESFRTRSEGWTLRAGRNSICGRTFGSGPPLYFLNGFTGSSDLYCLLVWLLRDEFRCVVYDYPAGRRASTPNGRAAIEDFAADLFAVAEFLGDAKFSVFATSFGSAVALAAMASPQSRVERAVLQAAFAYRRLSAVERLLCRAGRRLPGTLARVPLRKTIERANHQRSFPPFDASRWSFFSETVAMTPIRDAAERGSVLKSFDYRDRLREIRQPVLLIHTEHEGKVTELCQSELARGLPNVTVETLHSTGPLAFLTHPHRLAKLLRSFLADVTE